MDDWKGLPPAIFWSGVTVGAVVVVILIYIVGARPSAVNIGPIQFDLPFGKDTTTCPPSAVIVDESLVNVPANKYWYDTGITAQKGDCLEFSATGSWWNGISTTGPDGHGGFSRPTCGMCPVPDGNLGELVGKVDDGVPFRIGNSIKRETDRSGNIILAMNENTGRCSSRGEGSCYDDNNGALKVKVTVRRIK